MKKLRSRGGFSLTETLIAVALLAILSAGGAVASGVVISVRNGMIQTADAQVLASTILETMADEVRFGQNIVVDGSGNVTRLDSMTFGPGAKFLVDGNGRIIATVTATVSGTGGTTEETKTYDLLTESAYSHLKVEADSFAMTKDENGNVKIALVITNGAGKQLWDGSLTVTPLNGI